MMRRQASCVRIVILRICRERSPRAASLRVQLHRGFDGGLRVELRRVADLEQHVLHHIGTIGPLELELLALNETS
jgi:hypothetical protein